MQPLVVAVEAHACLVALIFCGCCCRAAGTCVPLCYSVLLLRFLGVLPSCKIVFVESVCRTRSLSLTGLLLFPVTDRFVVQWEGLHQAWPTSEYLGLLF